MKKITDGIVKKIVILLLVVIAFSLINPINTVQAKSWIEGGLGDLLNAIMQFLMFIGDAIMDALQNNFISPEDAIVEATSESQKKFGNILPLIIGILAIAIGILVSVVTLGAGTAIGVGLVIKGVLIGVGIAAGGGFVTYKAGTNLAEDLKGSFDIPMFAYTPYTIFSGQIPAFDVNFIDPQNSVERQILKTDEQTELVAEEDVIIDYLDYTDGDTSNREATMREFVENKKDDFITGYTDEIGTSTFESDFSSGYGAGTYEAKLTYEWIEEQSQEENENAQVGEFTGDIHYLVTFTYSSYFTSGGGYSENAFLKKEKTGIKVAEIIEYESSGSILQNSIATWYKVLRRVALVVLLSMLVFVGIKIIISSSSEDKAKYKKRIFDWLAAICLLFILQYIMVFVLAISSNLSNIFVKAGNQNICITLPPDTKIGEETLLDQESTGSSEDQNSANMIIGKEGELTWIGDFVGYIRLTAGVNNSNKTAITFGLMYLVLVIYTCTFTFMYIKRVLWMAFLTMIAPLIAVTYPLDKIKDGQAQAWGLWIKEYVFNALIQPLHLIIYTMTISTVMELAIEYPVYALVALGFIMPAEGFLRKMFGFEKAETIGAVGAVAGGAAVYSGIQKLSALNRKRNKDKDENEKPERTADKNGIKLPQAPNILPTGSRAPGGGAKGNTKKRKNTGGLKGKSKSKNGQKNISGPKTGRGSSTNSAKGNSKMRKALRRVGTRYTRKIKKSKPLRSLAKLAGTGVGAATLGMVGLAAGIASGDASKAFSYTAGAAGVGGALGGTLTGNAWDSAGEAKEAFAKGAQGEQEYNNKKLDAEYFGSDEYLSILDNDNIYSGLKGRDREKRIKEDVQKYRSSGITDTKTIMTGMTSGLNTEEAIYAAQLAKAIGESGWNDPVQRADFQARYNAVLGNNAQNIWNSIENFF